MISTLVLFDIDGTLMRGAGKHHKDALLAGIQSVTGRQASFDGIDTAGKLDMDLIAALVESIGASPQPSLIATIAQEAQRLYTANCGHDLSPFVCRGARELVQSLAQRGVALALVTGNLSAIGWRKVELAGLKPHFHTGAFSDDAPTRAEIAKLATRRAPRHDRVFLIGDHRNDIEAAKANGFFSIAVASGPMPAAELQTFHPDVLVHSLADLDIELFFS